MKQVKEYLMYLACITLLLIIALLTIKIIEQEIIFKNKIVYEELTTYESVALTNTQKNITINYPKFDYDKVDKKIIKIIKKYNNYENTIVTYNLFLNESLLSLFFTIETNETTIYKNINYSIKTQKFTSNNYIYDFNIFGNVILEKIKDKYSTKIYETILKDNFKHAYIELKEDLTTIYFAASLFQNINHKVYIELYENEEEVLKTNYDKVIAFTFDDGPSEYTLEIMKTLLANNSKATFFELGNRMKYNQNITLELYNNGMEIGSHTYAHKNLNKLSVSEIDEEINKTNIIYNEITNDTIKLLRPPYGNANSKVKERVTTPIINWNVDTEDWLKRDADLIYNHILENVTDGSIILMHDTYPETVEAVKKVLPLLNEMGYKVTTVSELASIKNKTLEKGMIYRKIN